LACSAARRARRVGFCLAGKVISTAPRVSPRQRAGLPGGRRIACLRTSSASSSTHNGQMMPRQASYTAVSH
jgi:hypothetical protein